MWIYDLTILNLGPWIVVLFFFFFQAEDGIRDRSPSRGLGDVYKRQEIWGALSDITASDFECESRIYGGGLKKIEPRELSLVRCSQLAKLLA